MSNGGPPNKWFKFEVPISMTSEEVLSELNQLADQGINSVATTVICADGQFVFVGGYKK